LKSSMLSLPGYTRGLIDILHAVAAWIYTRTH
jgi:hypothetical protein